MTVPPYDPVNPDGMTNALFSFEGKPTIFGDVACDDSGECANRKIVQYDPEEVEWLSTMIQK